MDTLKGKDILHGNQFTKKDVETILKVASEFEKELKKKDSLSLLNGKILATLFFEPSTRTRLSFEAAMQRLGGGVISMGSVESSSVAKGETLADTARTVAQYADVIVLRHPRLGSAKEAADAVPIPVINAGDGAGQHPTQALLDVYTIQKEIGFLKNLTISLVGDLKYGRTVHALVELLSLFKARIFLVSPNLLRMPEEITSGLKGKGIEVIETEDMAEAAKASSILYMTRIQKERFTDLSEYERLKGSFILNEAFLNNLKRKIIILHPLPRVDEIHTDVDAYPGAAYFRQMRNGVFVRMALLAMIFGKK
ncbi:MAG: aspartate carbamoyltransferase [Deltaproteobacteria bacterium]|nr:aspartate carbamoyltransferase [Deltaproteobacteria bacterium]MBM4322728.1 aspartate carbamoyltransferase [Deltaproteobacteria bacterium]MBM4347104.1 aspartate carbamoyltransferase [Deltaproteobacteria bacterium]